MGGADVDRIIEFLQTSRRGDNRPIPNFSGPMLGVGAYRSILVDCVEASNASALWDEVLRLAVYLNRSAPSATLMRYGKAAPIRRASHGFPVTIAAGSSSSAASATAMLRGWC